MDLNIGKIVFQNESSNSFQPQYKENIFIAENYKQKIKNFIKTKTQNILKTFETTQVQFFDGDLILGDKGGYVFRLTELSVCTDLYSHNNPIIWLKINESENCVYSACMGRQIYCYNFNDESLEIDLECQENTGSAFEYKENIYQATTTGNLYVYNKKTLETIKKLQISKFNLNSISESFENLYISDVQGGLFEINKTEYKQNKKIQLKEQITKIKFDQELKNILVSNTTGKLIFLDMNLKQQKEIQFQNSKITDFKFFTDQNLALIFLYNGSINKLNIEESTYEEIRKNQYEGDQKLTFNYKNDIFYVIGHEGVIEKWILKQQQIMTRIYRNEIHCDDCYDFQYFNNIDSQFYCFLQTHSLFQVLIYSIENSLKNNKVNQRIEVQGNINGEIIYANSFIQLPDFIYLGLSNQEVAVYEISSNSIQKIFKPFDNNIISINYNSNKQCLVMSEKYGKLTYWNPETYKNIQTLTPPMYKEVVFSFISETSDVIFFVKKQGNCQAFDIKDKILLVDKILNEESIELVTYCEKMKILFTSQAGGIINQTTFLTNENLDIKEVIDKDSEIIAMQVDQKGKYLAYSTDKRCVYIYDIEKSFKFDKMGKNFFDTKIIFFSPNKNIIFCSGNQANLKGYKILKDTQSEVFQSFNSLKIYSVALNDFKIFISKEQFMEVWSIYNNDLEQIVYENYEPAVNMVVDESGEILYTAHKSGIVKLWSTQTLKLIDDVLFFDDQGDLLLMQISQDQSILILYYESQALLIFDLIHKEILNQFRSELKLTSFKISPNNSFIAAEISTSQLFIYSMEGDVIRFIGKKSNQLRGYGFTQSNNYICMAYRDSMITQWDIINGEIVNIFDKINQSINDIVFSKDHNTILVLTNRGQLFYISSITGKCYKLEDISQSTKTSFLVNYNDKLVYTSKNKVYFYDATERLSFFVKQYIKKSFFDYGKTTSEKDFQNYFQYLEQYYQNSKILQTNFNPILVCALFNYQGALQQIFKENKCSYPFLNDQNQISPLILAIRLGNLNLAQIMLRNLSQNPSEVLFSNREMKELISSEYEFTHRYLKNFIIEIKNFSNTNQKIPLLSQFQQLISLNIDNKYTFTPQKFKDLTNPTQNKTFSEKNKEKLSTESKIRKLKTAKFGGGLDNSDINSENQDLQTQKTDKNSKLDPIPQKTTLELDEGRKHTEQNIIEQQEKQPKMISWISTRFYRINGIYSFKTGSKESLEFLINFSKSKSKEFVLSDWRFIIDYKWNKLFWKLIPTTLLIWILAIFYSLYLLFPDSNIYFIITLIALFVNFIYEMVSMFIATPKVFLRSIFNIIDLCIIIFGTVILLITFVVEGRNEIYDNKPLKYFQVLQLSFMYFRAMTYLRIFYFLRNVIHMLIDITMTSTSFLFIILSFVLAFNVMFNKASDQNDQYKSLLQVEFTSLQGQIDFDQENFNWLEWLMFILNSILLPIILINFLIAKMSNKYEALEQHEQFTSYVEKAKLIAEIEYFYQIKNNSEEFEKLRGFTFITRNSQKDKHSEQLIFQEKLEENFESFEKKIQEIYEMYQQQQKKVEEWNYEFVNDLNLLKSNFDNIKEELDFLKTNQTSQSIEVQEKVDELQQIVHERVDYIYDKFELLKPKKRQQLISLNKFNFQFKNYYQQCFQRIKNKEMNFDKQQILQKSKKKKQLIMFPNYKKMIYLELKILQNFNKKKQKKLSKIQCNKMRHIQNNILRLNECQIFL